MNDSDTTYNGWRNYETWATNLWLGNEPYSEERGREIVAEYSDDRLAESAMRDLAEEIAYGPLGVDVDGPDGIPASLGADLIGAALSSVDWAAIVAGFRED